MSCADDRGQCRPVHNGVCMVMTVVLHKYIVSTVTVRVQHKGWIINAFHKEEMFKGMPVTGADMQSWNSYEVFFNSQRSNVTSCHLWKYSVRFIISTTYQLYVRLYMIAFIIYLRSKVFSNWSNKRTFKILVSGSWSVYVEQSLTDRYCDAPAPVTM